MVNKPQPITMDRYFIGKITIGEATTEATLNIPEQYRWHTKIFSEQESQWLPKHTVWDHAIELLPGALSTLPGRLLPLTQEEIVEAKKFVEENLHQNTIHPLWSPYAANFFFVKKKDGKLWPVQDYQLLNKWTKKNRNVSPLIPSVVDRLAGCSLFTKFNIHWGYNNIHIKPGDEWKAAFLTPEGLFEPTVMFFGLTNSPATFQMMMNTIFRWQVMLGWFFIFMDDSVIHMKQWSDESREQHITQHCRYVYEIFNILAENDLYVKPEKCAFEQEEIKYLGVIVGKGQLHMDLKKLHAILNNPILQNVTDVRAFLGFTGYYCYFIKNYSAIVRPLLVLTRKSAAFHWGREEQEAFDKICTIMCQSPVLRQPDFQKKFYLQTDASAYSVGAILSQEGDTSTPSLVKFKKSVTHPIAFFLATFTPTEQNYDIYKRELLAVMKALAHWRPYLRWTKFPFTIMTNHTNLQYWKSPKNLNWRTARWHAEILYVPGKTNTPLDTLSWPSGANRGETDNKDVVVLPENKFVLASITTTLGGKIIVPSSLKWNKASWLLCMTIQRQDTQAETRPSEEHRKSTGGPKWKSGLWTM